MNGTQLTPTEERNSAFCAAFLRTATDGDYRQRDNDSGQKGRAGVGRRALHVEYYSTHGQG